MAKLLIFKPVGVFFPFSRHIIINISCQSLETQERISGLVLTKYINRTAVHWKVSVPRCSLTLAQSIRLCDIFLMRGRNSTLLRVDILEEMNDPSQGAESSKPYLECRADVPHHEPRQLPWCNS